MKTQNNLFKARASASGKLMTAPRAKSETLSETTKTYVYEWLKESIYGIRKLDLSFAIKNEKFFEDDYFTGTPDLIVDGVVYDTKCSWDCFTFPLFDNDIPTKDYYYQLQVYMHLTGCKKACLVYVLLNTPEELTYEEKHNYDDMDAKYRIKHFEIEYNAEVIEQLQNKVLEVREFINNIKY
jgi:hypothetical protein